MKIKSVPANSSTLSEERALEKLPQDAFGFRQEGDEIHGELQLKQVNHPWLQRHETVH